MTSVPTTTTVTVYKAVIDQTGSLVNQGDNVAFGFGDKVNNIVGNNYMHNTDNITHTGRLR